ncbi:MAG TPA: hypothetical protein DCS43_09175 [Verrucomicrobia bacterium]|nr:hypothetical protein [Verrucomicrobiota bacterium]
MANEMSSDNGLPPKLDLRKRVSSPEPTNPAVTAAAPNIQPAVTPVATPAAGVAPLPVASAKPMFTPSAGTVRLNMEGRTAVTPKPISAIRPMLKPISTMGGSQPAAAAASIPVPAPVNIQSDVVSTAQAHDDDPTVEATVLPEDPFKEMDPSPALIIPPAANAPAGATPVLRPTLQSGLTAKTIKLKKPVPIGIKRDAPEADAAPGTKRETSKITLPSDLGPSSSSPAAPGGVQTIRIAPTSTTSISPLLAGDAGNVAMAPILALAQPVDPKRQTSRISLEAAMGHESASPSGPKTIKLKKPGSATAVMRNPGLGALPAVADEPIEPMDPVPTDGVSEDESTNTQKKTIKVKRPSVHPSMRPGGDSGHSGEASTSGTAPMFVPPSFASVKPDSAHWFFIICACAATVVIGVLIYVLCAQVMGPNISLTKLAYFAPDAEFPWPGRITR